ncbi:MAG: LLM class F420-dependent oxidoreductase [Candidatus Rokuibacteriota bacterium]
MNLGAIFPQTECGTDVGAITEYVQAVEAMGYDHLFVADHVLGADPRHHQHPSLATYSHRAVVHETLTLLAYLAARTRRIGLATGILILPQRQTALVAKQAAEIDVLSGGRLRLGIGVGWNAVEYEALGLPFDDRGARCAEQVEVMRALWTQEVVDFAGKWHRISHAGLNPMPVQRPIPVWFGVGSREQPHPPEAVLKRVARLADGWSPNFSPDEGGRALVARVHAYAREAGRDPARLPLEGRVRLAGQDATGWVAQARQWRALGAASLIAEARGAGLTFPAQHLAKLQEFRAAVASLA